MAVLLYLKKNNRNRNFEKNEYERLSYFIETFKQTKFATVVAVLALNEAKIKIRIKVFVYLFSTAVFN